MIAWLPILVPAGAGVITLLLGERRSRARNAVNLGAAAVSSAVVLLMARAAYAGGPESASRIAIVPGFTLGVSGDLLGLLFSAVATVLWGITLVYAIGYMEHDDDRARFFGFFAWCIAAANGVALAEDPVSLFIFYEILTLTTYPLVVHSGTAGSPPLRDGNTSITHSGAARHCWWAPHGLPLSRGRPRSRPAARSMTSPATRPSCG